MRTIFVNSVFCFLFFCSSAMRAQNYYTGANRLNVIQNLYSDWVSRSCFSDAFRDTIYYTRNLDESIIDSTISGISQKTNFNSQESYNGKFPLEFTLSSDEQSYLIAQLLLLKEHEWPANIFPMSLLIEQIEIDSLLISSLRTIETFKEGEFPSIISFSKPILFRNNFLCLYIEQTIYRYYGRTEEHYHFRDRTRLSYAEVMHINASFYAKEMNGGWQKYSDVYYRSEHSGPVDLGYE